MEQEHEKDEKESRAGIQGQDGAGGAQGRQDPGGVGGSVRRSSEPDSDWKQQLMESAADVFDGGPKKKTVEPDLKVLHAKIGELTLENDFLESALTKAGLLSAKR